MNGIWWKNLKWYNVDLPAGISPMGAPLPRPGQKMKGHPPYVTGYATIDRQSPGKHCPEHDVS